MDTLGNLLLLLNTYGERSVSLPHKVTCGIPKSTFETLETVLNKVNYHYDKNITKAELVRLLLTFAFESLELHKLAECEGSPLDFQEDSAIAYAINSLEDISDMVNLPTEDLVSLTPGLELKNVIWKDTDDDFD